MPELFCFCSSIFNPIACSASWRCSNLTSGVSMQVQYSLRVFWVNRFISHIFRVLVSRSTNIYAAVIRRRSSVYRPDTRLDAHLQWNPFSSPSRPPARLCPAPSAPEPSWKRSSPWRRGTVSFFRGQPRRTCRLWAAPDCDAVCNLVFDHSFRLPEGIRITAKTERMCNNYGINAKNEGMAFKRVSWKLENNNNLLDGTVDNPINEVRSRDL